MTFLQLYGVELDRELGSSSTTLFSNTRRKAAINAAAQEWVKRTECLTRQATILLADGVQEYDLEAVNVTSGALTLTIAATAGTITRATGSFITNGFIAGQVITLSGFTNAGNNVSKVIDTVAALTLTVTDTTGLVDETGDGDELVVVQLADFGWLSKQGVSIRISTAAASSGALTLTIAASAGTITRGSGSFVTDGFSAGQTITISGFTTAANNTSKVISTVAALVITVTDVTGLVDETGGGDEAVEVSIVRRYLEGDDLEVTTIERLNAEEPGWRAVTAGTPKRVYLRRADGAMQLGFYPAPDISSLDVWEAIVPYVPVTTDMSADTDEPFTLLGSPVRSLRPWHRALAHYAAHDLEKLRKDPGRSAAQLQLFDAEVEKFTGVEKPKGGRVVRMAKAYRRTSASTAREDPRVWP